MTITNEEFHKLADYIRTNYGIQLKEEKKMLVTGRLQSVLTQLNLSSFSEYYDYLVADKTGEAVTNLLNKITTNHTFFMREPEHFYYFRDTVLPAVKSSAQGNDLRIWSAGCSTGEEPYTLAMIIDEALGREKTLWDTKILATDISDKALETAKKGLYSNRNIMPLPLNWRMNYFEKHDVMNSSVKESIKKEVIFGYFNLMNPTFTFRKKFHVIFCRNVMIYFNNETKLNLLNRFYDATESGGYLFVGHSESFNRDSIRYKFVRPAVYRKE